MELNPKLTRLSAKNTHRLVRSLYPTTGIFDDVAEPDELKLILELEGWTNDRISAEYGVPHLIPENEWVLGTPLASIVMAAFCHPAPGGGRFNSADRGAWYAAIEQETAIKETVHHYTTELFDELGITETYVQLREYLVDFEVELHDVRPSPQFDQCYADADYTAGQALGQALLRIGSNGVLYKSVRDSGRDCIACFRPKLLLNVRQAAHFEYRWNGSREPEVKLLNSL
jgi:RES domain-containing protein